MRIATSVGILAIAGLSACGGGSSESVNTKPESACDKLIAHVQGLPDYWEGQDKDEEDRFEDHLELMSSFEAGCPKLTVAGRECMEKSTSFEAMENECKPGKAFYKAVREARNSSRSGVRTSEAQMMIGRLADGARIYYMSEHVARGSMTVLTGQFPASAELTPAEDCCSQGGKCAASAAPWQIPTWQALDFDVRGNPHYFQYQVEASGAGADARLKLRAVGDPKCDGNQEIWESEVSVADGKAIATKAKRTDKNAPSSEKPKPGDCAKIFGHFGKLSMRFMPEKNKKIGEKLAVEFAKQAGSSKDDEGEGREDGDEGQARKCPFTTTAQKCILGSKTMPSALACGKR